MKPNPPTPPPRPHTVMEQFPEHAQLIGSYIAEWNEVERNLIFLLALTEGVASHAIMPLFYAIKSSRGRLEAMTAAFKIVLKGEWKDKVLDTLDRAGGILTLRDTYAHAIYLGGTKEKGSPVMTILTRRGSRDVPLADLKHAMRELKAFGDQVLALLWEYTATLHPSQPEASDRPDE